MGDKAKTPKNLTIDIQYRDSADLKDIFDRIYRYVHLGLEHYKEERNHSKFNFDFGFEYPEFIECREEIIDGKKAIIIPSKMNKS